MLLGSEGWSAGGNASKLALYEVCCDLSCGLVPLLQQEPRNHCDFWCCVEGEASKDNSVCAGG